MILSFWPDRSGHPVQTQSNQCFPQERVGGGGHGLSVKFLGVGTALAV